MTNTNHSKKAVFISLSILMIVGSAWGSTESPIAASFLKTNPSVRAMTLGGYQAALRGGVDSLTSNPSSLTKLSFPELMMGHREALENTSQSTLLFGAPIRNQFFALQAQFLNDGTFQKTGIDGSQNPIFNLGESRYSTLFIGSAWATTLRKNVSLGLYLKGWQEDRGGSKKSGWAGDAGLQAINILQNLNLGLVARNVGPEIDGFSLPTDVAMGGAYHFPIRAKGFRYLSFLSEVSMGEQQSGVLRSGLELKGSRFDLRAGYENSSSDLEESLTQLQFGAGLQIKGWQIDYGWRPRGEFEDEHNIALKLGFGLSEEERQRAAQELDRSMEARIQNRAHQYYQAGLVDMNNNQFEKAQENFTRALEWDAQNKEARQAHVLAQSKLTIQKANLHYQKGLTLSQTHQWLEAAFEWKQTLKLNPAHTKAKQKLKLARQKINKKNLKAKKGRLNQKFDRAVSHYLNGDLDQALELWNQVLNQNPNYPNLIGYIEKARRIKLERKVSSLEKAVQKPAVDIDRLAHKAYTFYKLRQTDKAIQIWNQILTLDPTNEDAKGALKKMKEGKNLFSPAQSSNFTKMVMEIDGQAIEAYKMGNVQEASRLWKKALAMDPHNKWIKEKLKRAETQQDQGVKK